MVVVYQRCLHCNEGSIGIHKLGVWKDGHYTTTTTTTTPSQFRDLQGHVFEGVTMDFPPFIDYTRTHTNPRGIILPKDSMDTRILKEAARMLNFSYILREPSDGLWGGSLISRLTVPALSPTLDTLEQLASSDHYEWGMLDTYGSGYQLFRASKVHMARVDFFPGGFGWAFPPGSPYLATVDGVLLRLIESGLIDQWMDDLITLSPLLHQSRKEQKDMVKETTATTTTDDTRTRSAEPFTVFHLQGIFFIMLGGFILAVITFMAELTVGTRSL
ncbi:hypothetical protein Pmani_008194 [Petrolisthes manimaculis]|uniref:Uncharacterized protein n=1 Tax=Petrolisthes manimaculis TaxID=1843537 RepID=A0AAE1Q707_9EUCA|nr:hypothetical protein Pmani_008194 [Petrolisthes manimaculis]